MIIQCEQCRTKFRLDDSRVKDAGVKVRCAKCKHIFTVRKELPEPLPQSDFAALLEQTAGVAEQAPPASPFASELEGIATGPTPEFTASSFASTFASIRPTESTGATDSTLFEPPEKELPPSGLPAAESAISVEGAWEQALDADKTAIPPVEFSGSGDKFPFQTPDIAVEETAASKLIDADAFSFDVVDSAPEPAAVPPQEKIPEEPAVAKTTPIAPREEQPPKVVPAATPPEPAAPAHEEELPPLSISSRRKQGPLVKVLLVIIILIAAAALYFQYGSSLLSLVSHKTATESGEITLRSIDASFVKNEQAGELLVISGEAVNSYTTPRTAIQVKGVVYGDNNQILASKNAFSGNILSKEQLATMTLDKIEAAMANQFGGALANLEVAPGKAVPFMIVISKLPEGAKNFGALPAGSAAITKPKP